MAGNRFYNYVKFSSLALLTMAAPGMAQDYPERVVRMIVPFAAGGGTDVLGRAFAERLTGVLGQNVIVENIGGAAGFIGTQEAIGSDPDGYTVLFAPTSPYELAKHSTPPATYNPETDLRPVARIAEQPTLFAVRADAGYGSLEDFIAAAKEAPGDLSYSSSGAGGEMHLTGEELEKAADIDLLHVGYRGGGPAILALVSGEVDMMPVVTGSIMSYIEEGSVTALATTASERLPNLPDIPTTAELGYGDVDHVPSWGLFVSSEVPEDIRAVLADASEEIANSEEFGSYLESLSIRPAYLSGDEFREVLAARSAEYEELLSTLTVGE